MVKFEPGSWVWIEDDEEKYLPAKVQSGFTAGEATTVRTEDGEDHKLDAKQSAAVIECNNEVLNSNVQDLINISDLNEMSILHSLRIRFKEDKIYTSISAILVSVNPFRLLPLYTPEILAKYRDGNPRDLAPHVFQSANTAYTDMLSNNLDQSVVISGESGAGKSEAMKLILQFLTVVSGRASGSGEGGNASSVKLEQQILAANPILEAFGNAKTSRNNNSSRFGKLITINFDSAGVIIGGGIINYLLEKSRVCRQTEVERNYHIFYQLLTVAQTDPTLAAELDLKSADLFDITNPNGKGVVTISGTHSDEKDFEDMCNSMRVLNFTDQEKTSIFRIVAGVLHFGNVQFKATKADSGDEGSAICNMDTLKHACKVWNVDEASMAKFLTAKNLGKRSVVLVPYTKQQACDARDAMIKKVYGNLFQMIVNKINDQLSAGGAPRHKFIGVLDIFGFESFEVNSFEQLCINFCNEKLQFHFNEHIFKMEQTLYAEEGIVIPGSSFVDNQPTLDLLELKGTGIFSLCDEEINVPRGTDDTYLNKMAQKHGPGGGKHPNFVVPKGKVCLNPAKCFGVNHYAGVVYYDVSGFLDKNKDQLHTDLQGVLSGSTMSMIADMFEGEEGDRSRTGGAKNKKMTLGGQFKMQLNELIDTLNSTHPNFIRCMKSNDEKVGRKFNAGRMQDQLRYAGLVEVCRIRKLGFPVRRPFQEFFLRFKCCDLTSPNLDAQLASLESKGKLIKGEWAKGKTRVFMRTAQAASLEAFREESLTTVAKVVQTWVRRFLARKAVKHYFAILKQIEDSIKLRTEEAVDEAIGLSSELPWGGTHMKQVKEGSALLKVLQEENRVLKLVSAAIESQNLATLKSALGHAEKVSSPPAKLASLIKEAKEMVQKIEAELAVIAGLQEAAKTRSLSSLTTYIKKAEEMALTGKAEYAHAVALKKAIEEEEALLSELTKIAASKDLDALSACIEKCHGLGDRAEVKSAIQVRETIIAERGAAEMERQRKMAEEAANKRAELEDGFNKRLKAAMVESNATALKDILTDAVQNGIETAVCEEARALVDKLSVLDGNRDELNAALGVLKVKAASKEGVQATDIAPLNEAISRAEASIAGTNLEFPELELAKKMAGNFLKFPEIVKQLEAAIAANERTALNTAVSAAQNVQMDNDLVATARDMQSALESKYREEKAAKGEALEEIDDYSEAEEAREKRKEEARQDMYEFKNFPGLRKPADYAKGFIMSKTAVREGFLLFSDQQIPRSLTVAAGKDMNQMSVLMHQNILGYCGDKQMNFPADLARDLMEKGVKDKIIRDEIYCQLIKHLTKNPRPESSAKGWQLMCMCVAVFPPSFDFEKYLLHFILKRAEEGRGAVVDYAKYCIRMLEATLAQGEQKFVPSIEQILAYKERPPILATIVLVDDSLVLENVPIAPHVNTGTVLSMSCQVLLLQDKRINTLGIFVYDMGPIHKDKDLDEAQPYAGLARTPRPLSNDSFLGDVTVQKARQKRKYKFVIKQKIFLKKLYMRGNDANFERLCYLQGEDEAIVGDNLKIEQADHMAYLSAISLLINMGELGNSHAELMDADMPSFIAESWLSAMSEEEWSTKILEQVNANGGELRSKSMEDLQDVFLKTIQSSPLYGSHFFNVRQVKNKVQQWPAELRLGFSQVGLTVYDMDKNDLAVFPFADIHRWGGSSTQFSLVLSGKDIGVDGQFEFVVLSSQAADMAAIILDMIRAIMSSK